MNINAIALTRGHGIGGFLGVALLAVHGHAALAQVQHSLPLVTPADSAQQGFVRIINRSDRAGTVTIHGIDDTNYRTEPITLAMPAAATVHLNSQDLEEGNPDKELSGGLGDGTGDWRLELISDLDFEPLAYIRTADGFVTSMHDVVPAEYVPGTPGVDDSMRHVVRFFNPGNNRNQVSRLRVINTGRAGTVVTITGIDDMGDAAPGGEVRFTLPDYGARTLSAQELEQGADDLEGSLGDGKGKWQLTVAADLGGPEERQISRPLQVMSLLWSSETGHLTNVSTIGEGNDTTSGGPGTDWLWGDDGDDILNPGDNDDHYDSVYGSLGSDTIVYSDSGPTAFQWLGYYTQGSGITATIDGDTNIGTIDKHGIGTDTIVDIVNPLNAAKEPPYGAFGLGGTPFDDLFHLTLADGQWMDVRGEAGNDTFNIRSGSVKINYRHTLGDVEVDLSAGRAYDDGYGSVDTINGQVRELEGGLGNDTLLGTDGTDRLDGGPGNDVLNPRDNDQSYDHVFGSAGNDRIVYSDTGPEAYQEIRYDRLWRSESSVLVGTDGIEVTVDGAANEATVDKGPDGTDTVVDVANPMMGYGFGIRGTRADDVFNLSLGDEPNQPWWMSVSGGPGNDRFDISGFGGVRISYRYANHGVDVDLEAGRAYDDGYGDADTITINHPIWGREIEGSDFDDELRGSDRDHVGESFIGRHGNDTIDGRGGFDRVRYDRSEVQGVEVDLEAGFATGTWEDGSEFTHTLVSIEWVRGSHGDDELIGSNGNDTIQGRRGDDTIEGGAGNDRLEGEEGDDTFLFARGHGEDSIEDFSDGEDLIVLFGMDISSKDDVLNNAHAWDEGIGVWIDLRPFGGGTLSISGLPRGNFDASDFLL